MNLVWLVVKDIHFPRGSNNFFCHLLQVCLLVPMTLCGSLTKLNSLQNNFEFRSDGRTDRRHCSHGYMFPDCFRASQHHQHLNLNFKCKSLVQKLAW